MNNCLNCGKPAKIKYCSNKCQKIHQRPAFEKLKTDRYRRVRLIEERGHMCETCGLSKWRGQPIPLELDHIDGNYKNNSRGNLRVICPNCHAQTDTYKNKNMGNGRPNRR